MEFLKEKKNYLTILPLLFVGFCLIWIVRLEMQAATLQSRIQEHDDWLSKNKDILLHLDEFTRSVGNNAIRLSKTNTELGTNTTLVGTSEKAGFLQKGDSYLKWDENGIHIEAGKTKKSTIDLTDNGVKIKTGSSGDFFIELSPTGDIARIKKGDAVLLLGNTNIGEGVALGDKNIGTMSIIKNKGLGIGTGNDNPITINCGKDFAVNLKPKEKLIEIINGKAKIQVGKHKFGEGIAQFFGGEGTIAITKDKGVGIAGNPVKINGDENLTIKFEGDIDITAKGNINLKSTNGNVNIEGKKVNINE